MNLWQSLRQAEILLQSRGIEEPRVEAELLLRHSARLSRAELYAQLQEPLTDPEGFRNLIQRRLTHEPTAYITNRRTFYGLEFYVDSRVLIPRQETELLVQEALRFAVGRFQDNSCGIADVGTGSGAIAVSLAVNLPKAVVYATDISTDALQVASMNCERHGVLDRVHLLQGDLLEPMRMSVDIIVANLPYVSDSDMAQLVPETSDFEPMVALAGGSDGLDTVRQFLRQVPQRLLYGGALIFEIGAGQSSTVFPLCQSRFPDARVEVLFDLAGIDRVVKITDHQESS